MQRKLMAVVVAAALAGPGASVQAAGTGPSSSQAPYLIPIAPRVELTSILTVGDLVKKKHKGNESYRMVGIPDGLGAYDNGDGTITVSMNHELRDTAGVPRAHGGKGAFVSKWQIRKSDLKVLNGEDLIRKVYLWDAVNYKYVETENALFSRFCSADLPAKTAFFNSDSGLGFSEGYIFMNGEESGPQGRAFGHVVQGLGSSSTWELPHLGRFSWENSVASPYAQDKTIVAGLDDTGNGELYFYVGTKQASGSPIELAGLTGGMLYTMTIDGFANEPALGFTSAPFRLDVVENPLNATADLDGTRLNRPEDGAWDPRPGKENVFYFVTTDSFTGNSRLWQATFSDIRTPTAGGTIKVLIDGSVAGPRMMDNITVDGSGNVIIQEDPGSNLLPGNQSYQAKIWSYNTASQTLTELARFDPALFTTGQSGFITEDEESSGVIEVTSFFAGVEGYDATSFRYFLLDAQVHKNIAATDPELVEMGQLLLMKAPR